MKLNINDLVKEFDKPLTIQELLISLGMAKIPVVIELNKEAIFPRNYSTTHLVDNDSLEIITIAAGG